MKKTCLICLAVVLGLIRPTLADVKDIPSPRPAGWVTDQTGELNQEIVESINKICDGVKQQQGAEMAVVVIQTTGGQNHRSFATDLFNHWGIGDATKDNGVLILAALRDRRAEIILGDGIDDPEQIRTSQRIMDEAMIPLFRRGNPAQAVFAGARACARDILGLVADEAEALPVAFDQGFANEAVPRPDGQRGMPWWPWGVGGGALGIGAWAGGRRYLRYRKRTCSQCKVPMQRLSESEDDEHLSQAQRTEERIGSVNYDVWICSQCSQVQHLRYGAFFSSYSSCPACSARTKHSATRTIQQATTASTGSQEITEKCVNCNYNKVYTRTIPRITSSTTSTSSSSSSGFSGGSSSGGGASGGW